MRILVTGGAGFIGSHYVRLLLREHPEDAVVVYDKLTYAGNPDNLKDFQGNPRFSFVKGDIVDGDAFARAAEGCEAVVNFAAETHVDRSILAAGDFVRTDVLGAYTLLEWSRRHDASFLQVSTDEVYGSIPTGSFREDSPFEPNSPYAASKAGADLLVRAFRQTYGLATLVTRSSNNYGTHQHPEKLIPRFVTNLLRGRKVPLYGDGMNVRDWLHVEDNCRAIDLVLRKGRPGEAYNVGANDERTNLEVTRRLLQLTGRGEEFIERVPDRPGHDRRYSLDASKVRSLGWSPRVRFDEGLAAVVKWYRENEWWWKPLVEP
jgi:dTDP-glucose 4,6-dehydratase